MNSKRSRFVKFDWAPLATVLLVSGGSGRADSYLCVEWRRIMGAFKASGSSAGAN